MKAILVEFGQLTKLTVQAILIECNILSRATYTVHLAIRLILYFREKSHLAPCLPSNDKFVWVMGVQGVALATLVNVSPAGLLNAMTVWHCNRHIRISWPNSAGQCYPACERPVLSVLGRIAQDCNQVDCFSETQLNRPASWVMVFLHQSKKMTRQRQDTSWTCAFLWCLSHQICRTWCERHNRNAQVQHLSCPCLALVWKHH